MIVRLAGGAAIVSEHKVLREISGQLSGKQSQLKCEIAIALRRELQICDQILTQAGHSSSRCRTSVRNCAAISSVTIPPWRRADTSSAYSSISGGGCRVLLLT